MNINCKYCGKILGYVVDKGLSDNCGVDRNNLNCLECAKKIVKGNMNLEPKEPTNDNLSTVEPKESSWEEEFEKEFSYIENADGDSVKGEIEQFVRKVEAQARKKGIKYGRSVASFNSELKRATKQAKIDLLESMPIDKTDDYAEPYENWGYNQAKDELIEWKNKQLLDIKEKE